MVHFGRENNFFHPNHYQRGHRYPRMDMPADMALSEEWRQGHPLQIYIPGANDHGIDYYVDYLILFNCFEALK